jgi:hypothetical protein
MRKRGRKSAAELSVLSVSFEARRPLPPPELTTAQCKIWEAIVASTPGGWFTVAQEPLLSAYCRHVDAGNHLSAMIDNSKPDLSNSEGLRHHARLLGMRMRETMAALSVATKMRLTHQAQMHPRTAGRAMAGEHSGHKPWEMRKPWDDE